MPSICLPKRRLTSLLLVGCGSGILLVFDAQGFNRPHHRFIDKKSGRPFLIQWRFVFIAQKN